MSSRAQDKFVLRLPDGVRDRAKELAKAQRCSMNTVLVQAVESFLDDHAELRLLIDALKARQATPQ